MTDSVTDWEVRDLADADREAALDVRTRSFGPLPPGRRPGWDRLYDRTVAARRALGVFADGGLVACARLHAYRQFWGGRALPMAGVAGVVVAPEWRGRGVSRLLLTAVLRRAVELGDVLSVLFPSTLPPYRSLGWEVAGTSSRLSLPADALRRLGPATVPVRQFGADDVAEVTSLLSAVARSRGTVNAALDLGPDEVVDLLDGDAFCYLADDGVLVYRWEGRDLVVDLLAAGSPETTRALWALVGSGASTVRRVRADVAPDDPVRWLAETPARPEDPEDWMLRVLDARAALEGRGFPAGVRGEVRLVVNDPLLPAAGGELTVRIDDGRAAVTSSSTPAPTGSTAARLGSTGFAALYAGIPTGSLRAAAKLAGSRDDDPLLDAAFGARTGLRTDRF